MAIDRATRWIFVRFCNTKAAANARRFLRDLERAWPTFAPPYWQVPAPPLTFKNGIKQLQSAAWSSRH